MENMKIENLIEENRKRSEYLKKKWFKETYNADEALRIAIKEREELYEGLIKSSPLEEITKFLTKNNFKYTIWGLIVRIYEPFSLDMANELYKILKITGWYVATPKSSNKSNEHDWYEKQWYTWINKKTSKNNVPIKFFQIEPKYSTQINNANLPEYLYHVTPQDSRDSILSGGLRAVSKSKRNYHPERVYVSASIESAKLLLRDFGYDEFDCWKMHKEAASHYRWFHDVNFIDEQKQPLGYYTLEPINRYMIQLMSDDERIKYFGK